MRQLCLIILGCLISGLTILFLVSRTKVSVDYIEITEENTEKIEEVDILSFPQSYQEIVSDTLSFDAKILVPEEFEQDNFYETIISYEVYEEEKAYEIFVGEEQIESRSYELLNRDGTTSERFSYWNDSIEASFYDNLIAYKLTYADEYGFVFDGITTNLTTYNADQYSIEGEYAFATREEVSSVCEKILSDIGFSVEEIVTRFYLLDAETMITQSEKIRALNKSMGDDIEVKTLWDASEEAYFVYLWQSVQGLPLCVWKSDVAFGLGINTNAMEVIYTKDGLISARINDIYSIEVGDSYQNLLPFEAIVQAIVERYEGVEIAYNICISEMELVATTIQQGDDTLSVLPAWVCRYEESSTGQKKELILDATTGEKLYEK